MRTPLHLSQVLKIYIMFVKWWIHWFYTFDSFVLPFFSFPFAKSCWHGIGTKMLMSQVSTWEIENSQVWGRWIFYMVCFLNRTPRIDCYVVWWGSKSKHHTYTSLEESGLCLRILATTLHSIVSTNGRTYVSCQGINKRAFQITITE